MAFLEDEDRKFLWGLGLGLLAGVVAHEIFPSFKGVGRPLAKATVKSGITLLEKSKETLAEWGEVFEDLVVEARAELDEEGEAAKAAAEAPPTPPVEGEAN